MKCSSPWCRSRWACRTSRPEDCARSAATPDIPTLSESGLPDYEVIAWWGMLAPARTPRAVISKLNRELRAVLELPEVRRSLVDQGMHPGARSPQQFGPLINAHMEKSGY